MIVDAFFGFLLGLIEPVVNLLPVVATPLQAEAVQAGAASFATATDSVDQLIPIKGPVTFWSYVLVTTIPALVGYRVVLFVYRLVRG